MNQTLWQNAKSPAINSVTTSMLIQLDRASIGLLACLLPWACLSGAVWFALAGCLMMHAELNESVSALALSCM